MFGEIKFFVIWQVYYMKKITQSKYIKEILKNFRMEDSKLVGTPMVIGHKLWKNDDSIEVNQTLYMSFIRKLQSIIHRRPDIALTGEIVSRFFTNTRENHMMIVKRILRFLKGT